MTGGGDFGLSERTLGMVRAALRKFPQVQEALIFGSRAMGNYKNGSDIDLALMGAGADEATVRRISRLLNEELPLPYHVDVVAYEHCDNEALKEHIREHGRIFYSAGAAAVS